MKKIRFENKWEFRHYAKQKLLKSINAYTRDKIISRHILDIVEELKPTTLLLYIPLSIEPNIRDVIRICQKKCQVLSTTRGSCVNLKNFTNSLFL